MKYKKIKLAILIIMLIFLSGCTSRLITDVRVDEEGKILIEEKIDQPTLQKIEDLSKKTYLAYQGFTKKDWGLVVNYELSLSISSLSAFNEDVSKLSFSFTIPGKLIETNADVISGQELKWNSFEEDEIYARSRQIRWWLIGFIGGAVFLYLFYLLTRKK